MKPNITLPKISKCWRNLLISKLVNVGEKSLYSAYICVYTHAHEGEREI